MTSFFFGAIPDFYMGLLIGFVSGGTFGVIMFALIVAGRAAREADSLESMLGLRVLDDSIAAKRRDEAES